MPMDSDLEKIVLLKEGDERADNVFNVSHSSSLFAHVKTTFDLESCSLVPYFAILY